MGTGLTWGGAELCVPRPATLPVDGVVRTTAPLELAQAPDAAVTSCG